MSQATTIEGRTFWEIVERRAAATPDAPMLLDEHDRQLSFAEYKREAERVAAGLSESGQTFQTDIDAQLKAITEAARGGTDGG